MVFELRGILHRIAAVVMVLASLYHVYYSSGGPARQSSSSGTCCRVRQDLSDAIGVMKYNLGLSADKPLLGRFSYIEKANTGP